MVTKLNKVQAGYHLLMILSNVDGKYVRSERNVIGNYVKECFPNPIHIENELETLNGLSSDDYFFHFINAMNDFYEDSTPEERIHFLDFAVKIVKADNKITVEENQYLKELFFAWDSDNE